MKLKTIIAKFLALVLTVGTTPMFMLPFTVDAEQTDQTFTVKESLSMSQAMNIPDLTFNYSYEAYAVDLDDSSSDIDDMPSLKSSVTISSTDTPDATGSSTTKTVTKSADILNSDDDVVTGKDFEHAGIYTYIVTQNKVDANSFKTSSAPYNTYGKSSFVSDDNTAYLLSISVNNKTDKSGLYIDNIVAAKFDSVSNVKLTGDMTKSDNLDFTNNYSGYEGLVIKNSTTGRGADLTKSFTYTITLNNPSIGALADNTVVVGYIYNSDGTAVVDSKSNKQLSYEFEFENGSATNDIMLKDDQVCSFERTKTAESSEQSPYLPVGTTFSITQSAESNYKTNATVSIPGDTDLTIEGKQGTITASNISIKSNEFKAGPTNSSNKVSFEATRNDYSLTGIIQNNAGLFILLALSAIVLVLVGLTNRRKRD